MPDLIAYILDHQAALTLALGWIASEALSLSRRVPANGVIQLVAQGLAWAAQRAPDALAVLARIAPQSQMASTASDKLPDKLDVHADLSDWARVKLGYTLTTPSPIGSAQSPPIPAQSPAAAPAPQKGPIIMSANTAALIGLFEASRLTLDGQPLTRPDGSPVTGPLAVADVPGLDSGIAKALFTLGKDALPLLTPGAHVTPELIGSFLVELGQDIHQPAVAALASLVPTIAPMIGHHVNPWALAAAIPALYGALVQAGMVKA